MGHRAPLPPPDQTTHTLFSPCHSQSAPGTAIATTHTLSHTERWRETVAFAFY
uniref:Uncharacterized protein n=1 Tax=Zea mays TaxID=4577 RepID=C0PBA6_MAIZE|nr:unknown [Zea mays]